MRFLSSSAVLLILGASVALVGCGESESPSTNEADSSAGSSELYSEKEAAELIKKVDAGESFSLVDKRRLRWRDADITFLEALPAKESTTDAICFSEGRIAVTADSAIVELVLTDGRRLTGRARHYGSGGGYKALDKKLRKDYFALRSMSKNRAYLFVLDDIEKQDKLRFALNRGKEDRVTLKVSYQKNAENLSFCNSSWVYSKQP